MSHSPFSESELPLPFCELLCTTLSFPPLLPGLFFPLLVLSPDHRQFTEGLLAEERESGGKVKPSPVAITPDLCQVTVPEPLSLKAWLLVFSPCLPLFCTGNTPDFEFKT